jgi:hypothetical protein
MSGESECCREQPARGFAVFAAGFLGAYDSVFLIE